MVSLKTGQKMVRRAPRLETYEEDVGNLVPGVGVDRKLEILVDLVGTVLEEEGSQSRATGAASEPKDERSSLGVVTGLKEPVVQMSSVILAEARNSDVARLLLSLLRALESAKMQKKVGQKKIRTGLQLAHKKGLVHSQR